MDSPLLPQIHFLLHSQQDDRILDQASDIIPNDESSYHKFQLASEPSCKLQCYHPRSSSHRRIIASTRISQLFSCKNNKDCIFQIKKAKPGSIEVQNKQQVSSRRNSFEQQMEITNRADSQLESGKNKYRGRSISSTTSPGRTSTQLSRSCDNQFKLSSFHGSDKQAANEHDHFKNNHINQNYYLGNRKNQSLWKLQNSEESTAAASGYSVPCTETPKSKRFKTSGVTFRNITDTDQQYDKRNQRSPILPLIKDINSPITLITKRKKKNNIKEDKIPTIKLQSEELIQTSLKQLPSQDLTRPLSSAVKQKESPQLNSPFLKVGKKMIKIINPYKNGIFPETNEIHPIKSPTLQCSDQDIISALPRRQSLQVLLQSWNRILTTNSQETKLKPINTIGLKNEQLQEISEVQSVTQSPTQSPMTRHRSYADSTSFHSGNISPNKIRLNRIVDGNSLQFASNQPIIIRKVSQNILQKDQFANEQKLHDQYQQHKISQTRFKILKKDFIAMGMIKKNCYSEKLLKENSTNYESFKPIESKEYDIFGKDYGFTIINGNCSNSSCSSTIQEVLLELDN